jgi:hypothetical protein
MRRKKWGEWEEFCKTNTKCVSYLLQLSNFPILGDPQLGYEAEIIYQIRSKRHIVYDSSCNSDLWRNKNHLDTELLVSQTPLN